MEIDSVDSVENQIVNPRGPEVKARCRLSGMRNGVTAPEVAGAMGVDNIEGLAIGSGLVDPPGTGGTLKIDISVEARRVFSIRTLFLGCEWQETVS